MTLEETLAQLESLGSEKVRAQNSKNGADNNQFGVRHGDIRKLAAEIKVNHELAINLWHTGNIDARLLAILLIKPKNLSGHEVDQMVRSVNSVQVADWFISYVVSKHPDKETLRQRWMAVDDPWAARAGWGLDLRAHRQESGRARPQNAHSLYRECFLSSVVCSTRGTNIAGVIPRLKR